ncbi:hypothetical protein BH10ACI4_BH10ACI4_08220 [soil metagenome]
MISSIATETLECSDGSCALEIYIRHRPDVVLMDIAMPLLDGIAATRQIMQFDSNARIIIVTDYDDEEVRAASFEAGARSYVLKQNLDGLRSLLSS